MIRLMAFIGVLAGGVSVSAVDLNNAFFNSNWNVMNFHQTGNHVSGEYIYDQGVITATLYGDTLRGWWREYNNAQTCGPQGVWSGSIAFLFSPDGKTFTGSWSYCGGNDTTLDLNGAGWAGTRRDSSYTQTECTAGGRYWCGNTCLLAPCGQSITENACLALARFWCSGNCSLEQCTAAIRPPSRDYSSRQSLEKGAAIAVDIRGRCLESERDVTQGYYIFHR